LLPVAVAAETGEGVDPAQLPAVQPEGGVPAPQRLGEVDGPAPAVVAERLVGAEVPDDDRAAAVLALRDHALELLVLRRLVHGVHCLPPVPGVGGRAPRYGP